MLQQFYLKARGLLSDLHEGDTVQKREPRCSKSRVTLTRFLHDDRGCIERKVLSPLRPPLPRELLI